MNVRFCVWAGSPAVMALILICDVPVGVLADVVTVTVTEIEFPLVNVTDVDG